MSNSPRSFSAWVNVVIAALLMVATLPGRTMGLGLITEPMLRETGLDSVLYASMNFWATLIGAAVCFPAGWLLDRFGVRRVSTVLVLALGAVVWQMSRPSTGIGVFFFGLILLTRAFGQSALSVASITAVGKSPGARANLSMAVYSVLLSVFFAVAFIVVGSQVRDHGWRAAWSQIALVLLVGVAPLTFLFLRDPANNPSSPDTAEPLRGASLADALRTPAFWIFACAMSLFVLVYSGLTLFNEKVLAERGFDQKTYHTFMAVSSLIALVGQFACGWLSQRWAMQKLLGIAMFFYAAGIGLLPFLRTLPQLWVFAVLIGLAGGMITVIFFAIWGHAFGTAQLGRIQGAAQMLTVLASALGPYLLEKSKSLFGSYSPMLLTLAPLILIVGLAAWRTKLDPVPVKPTLSAGAVGNTA